MSDAEDDKLVDTYVMSALVNINAKLRLRDAIARGARKDKIDELRRASENMVQLEASLREEVTKKGRRK